MRLFLIFALVIAFLAILFALQNNTIVTISLLFQNYRFSLAVVLLSTLAIGVIIGLLFSMPAIVRRGWRGARLQRQSDDLTAQVEQQAQTLHAQTRKIDSVREGYGDLLDALGMIEPVTGLLNQRALEQAVASLLSRMGSRRGDQRYQSVCVLTLQSVLAEPSATAHTPQEVRALWHAAGVVLRQHAEAHTWLYSDGAGRFVCTFTGLDAKAANDYGETLRRSLTQEPVALPSGQPVPLEVSGGGAIATRENPTTAAALISATENALTEAQQRGHNRLRLQPI